MNKDNSKYIVSIIVIILLMIPLAIFASTDFGVADVNVGLGDNDVKDITRNIINIVLSFLGIIAVGFVIYAGFVWMTAGGSADKIDKAKKILIRAGIGIVIILSSYAIASFVIRNIGDATGLADGSGGTNTGPGGFGGGDANLIVRNWQPHDGAIGTARNILVRIYFNKLIDAGSVANADFSFTNTTNNTTVNFSYTVTGSRIDIQPLITCEVEGVDYCLGDTQAYTVSIASGSITSIDDKDLVCISGCSTDFITSDYIDITPPIVSLVNPQDNDTFSIAANVAIEAQASDDSGTVAALTFLADNEEIVPEGTDGAEPWLGLFSTVAYDEGDNIGLRAIAEDLSGNIGSSDGVDIRILPAYCFNQTQDEDETDIDCGGSCGACLGESCDNNDNVDICEPNDSLCGQGVCDLSCTCALSPIITNMSPDNGAVGNYITINGDGFGSSEGQIVFLGSASSGDEVVASIADCAVAWSPWQVIVEVPQGVISGGVKLINSGGDFDTTLDARGWQGDFILNETIRPGICGIAPESGTALSNITIDGAQFGDIKDRVVIGGISVAGSDISAWSNTNIVSLIPNIQPGKISVAVSVGDELSNPVQFEVIPDILLPSISYIEPDNGPIGTYVTIYGNNFGFYESDVLVNFINEDTIIPADIDFPEMCGDYSVDNTEIVVKVPEGVSLGSWNVIVNRDLKDSLPAIFDVNESVLSPGLCLLEPDNGPVGTIVDAYGEGFGPAGQFSFFDNIISAISEWSGLHIGSQVPVTASTGPVQIISGAGGVSNTINFAVGNCDANSCSVGDECCSDGICREVGLCEQSLGASEYIWSFTTGQRLPPFIVREAWPVCEDACINTMIGVEFSNPVDIESLTNIAIDVKQCTDVNCSSFVNEIDYISNDVEVGYYDDTNYILNINPAINLVPDEYYRVILKSGSLGIVNTEGGYLENVNYASAGGDIDSYSWIFRTGIDECTLDRVEILPQGRGMGFSPAGAILEATVFESVNSCENMKLLFNSDITLNSITDNALAIVNCTDNTCSSFIEGSAPQYNSGNVELGFFDEANRELTIQLNGLNSDSYYRVVAFTGSNGFKSVIGEELGALNYKFEDDQFNSYSWIFSTNTEGCISDIDEAVSLANTITSQEDRLNMTGYSFSEPDSCSLSGQMLDPAGFSWTWQSTELNTASVVGDNYEAVITPIWGHPAETSIIATADGVSGDAQVIVDMDIPRIDSISPDNGMINENLKTYVTIHGDNFGDKQGSTVVLVGGLAANTADCNNAWSNTQIVIEMPLSTASGDTIQVIKTRGDDESDPFTVNSIIRPALCSIDPVYGTDGTKVTLEGYNFGDAQNDGTVFFDQLGVDSINSWSNTKIKTSVPTNASTGPVTVNVLGNDSNSVIFSLEPYITKLSPDNGSVNSYVTIYGGNFGDEQGSSYVLIGGQRAYLAPCLVSWSNTSIIVQVPGNLSLGNKDVQVVTHYGIASNKVKYEVNQKLNNPLLCEINPNWAASNETVRLLGDNFGKAPRLSDQMQVDTDLGANYIASSGSSCMSNNGSYVSGCTNYWVEYQFNFTESGYYNAWAEISNYTTDLTDQGIYHNVKVYIDGEYFGYFSNIASLDHHIGFVDIGWVSAGSHTIRYYWTNDWCGGCGDGIGDSNIRIYNVGINTGMPMSYPIFTRNYTAATEDWSNSSVLTHIDSEIQSGPVSLMKEVIAGQQCAGFHIGNWCPGNVYEDITETIESNSVDFNKGCVIGTTSSREDGYIPTVADNSEAVGTLATDGKYIYGKSWGGYDQGDNIISIIGSGYQDTVLGQDYGDLVGVASSLTMTYHSDGYLYNGIQLANQLEKIDVEFGAKDTIVVPTGLMERSTGNLNTAGYKLITSDGKYFYNLAYGHDGSVYNGFKVRVYDINNNWSLIREWISGNSSFYTDGIIADGKYIYAIEWGGQHRIRKMNSVTGEYIAEWVSEQGNGGYFGSGDDIISGQYDWVNDKVWLGDLVDHNRYSGPAYIYKYNSCNSYIPNEITNPRVLEIDTCENNNIQSPSPYKDIEDICVNASFSATFNTVMDDATFNDNNIKIFSCGSGDNFDESTCVNQLTFSYDNLTIFNTANGNGFVINTDGLLVENSWHQVRLTSDIETPSGFSLTPYNWYFKTGSGECQLDHISITPADISVYVGNRQEYTALPFSAHCEILPPGDFVYDWLSSDTDVAEIEDVNVSVNLVSAINAGETDIKAITAGVTGSIELSVLAPPNCGDNIVQSSEGEQCDDGNTSAGDGCSIYCQNEIITGGTCGDGVVQWPNGSFHFEQCDDGNASSGDGCSNICYLEKGDYFGNCAECDSEVLSSQIGWWPMDDAEGTIVTSSINNLNDGALVNDNNSWIEGIIGIGAIQFNGANRYITVADQNNNFAVENFTISVWVNLDEFYQEYSITTLKYDGDWNNHSQLNNTISGIDDFINISDRHNFGHLNADGEYYDTVAKIPNEIYNYDIIIWDHNTIDLDVSRLDRNKPVYLVVRGNRYPNYAGQQLASYDWPVVGYQGVWTTHTTQVKRSSIANNVFIISSDHTDTHSDIWCTWEHYPQLVGRDLGSLISVLSGQVVTRGNTFGIYTNNKTINGYVNFTGTLDNQNNTVSAEILDGWNYIALTYDNTDLKLYLNGVEADSLAYDVGLSTNDANILMGQFLVGAIDDVKIYDGARSAIDIQTSYNGCTNECTNDQNCGNGIVDAGETCDSCPDDVGECTNPLDCGNDVIDIGEECEIGLQSSMQGVGVINQYSCVEPEAENQCIAIGGWCGDGRMQSSSGEVCEAKVVVVSVGYDWQFKVNEPSNKYGFIRINGNDAHYVPRSWAVMVFDEQWNEESYSWFDVYNPTGDDPNIDDLIAVLANLQPDKNVVISTNDEPKTNAYDNETFINYMVELGADGDILRNLEYRSAYILATNTTTGKIFEDYSSRFGPPIYFASNKALDSLESSYDCQMVWSNGAANACQFDMTIGNTCGNGVVDEVEACDFDDLGNAMFNGETCNSVGEFAGGSLSCNEQCEIVTNNCVPGTPAYNICINTEISAEFDSLMDQNSFAGNIKFEKVTNICETGSQMDEFCDADNACSDGVCNEDTNICETDNDCIYNLDIPISYNIENIPPNDSEYSKLYIYPENGLLDIDSEYRATINGGVDGVQDIEGYTLSADYIWPFYTGDAECLISRVEITPSSYQFNSTNEIVNFTVHGYDTNNNTVTGDYSWNIQGNSDLLSIVGSNMQTVQVSTTGISNGELSLEASVYASENSQGTAQAPIDIFMCNVPWNYENETYNFKTRYCRGEGVNHVYNSGFEIDDNSNSVPDVWFDDIYDENWQDISLVSSDLNSGGNYAIELNNLQDGQSVGERTGIASGIIDVKDAIYTLSAQIKGELDGQLVYFGLRFMNANEVGLGGNGGYHYPVLNHTSISEEWTLYSASFRPSELHAGTEKVQVVFILAGNDELDKHVAWIDNVQLELGSEANIYEESNLLPSLKISPDAGAGDELLNILYLQSDYNVSDAIGLRVFTNFEHLAPIVWYQNNITNIGNPLNINVGGYSGLQEGRTTYVNAANNSDNNVYTNIFVLSYTDGANATTQNIFTQMYDNWTFNSNIESYNQKQALARDTKRLESMIQISEQLADYYHFNGHYPELQIGSYLAGTSVSVWDSWNTTLGAELGGISTDPINEHAFCGDGYDSITCWNPNVLDYICPMNSHVYRYDYVYPDYYLYSNFEYEGVTWKGDSDLYIRFNSACDNVTINNGIITSRTSTHNEESVE